MKQAFSKIWLGMIALILILGGILAWQFWLQRKEVKMPEESRFPIKLESYRLVNIENYGEECIPDGTYCEKETKLTYRDDVANKIVFVFLIDITKGTKKRMKETYEKVLKHLDERGLKLPPLSIPVDHVYRIENHEYFWFVDSEEVDIISVQEATVLNQEEYSYGLATGDNPVTKYLLSKYPPIPIEVIN